MGLTVWVKRQDYQQTPEPESELEIGAAQPQVKGRSVPALAELAASLDSASPERARGAIQTASAESQQAAGYAVRAQDTVARPSPGAGREIADFACYWSPGVVLFTDLAPFTGRNRLIKDLLAAVTAQWQQKVAQAEFVQADLLNPGQGAGEQSPTDQLLRAIPVFVNKRIVSAAAEVVLTCAQVEAEVTEHCAASGVPHIALPPLVTIATDVAAKRELWIRLAAQSTTKPVA